MRTHTDGTVYDGRLKKGQVWVKGRTVRVIVRFDEQVMVYKSKKNVKEGTVTITSRHTFREWLYSGAQPVKELIKEHRCVCGLGVFLISHINRCSCGAVIKVIER